MFYILTPAYLGAEFFYLCALWIFGLVAIHAMLNTTFNALRKKGIINLLFVFMLMLTAFCVEAQEYGSSDFKKKFNKADALVYDGAFLKALPLLEELYKSDTLNANLNHLLGICYLRGKKDHARAIKFLESASRDVAAPDMYNEANWKERKAPGITYYYLGKAYHFKNRFDRAVTNYYNYRSFVSLDDVETYNQVRQQIQYAENAQELVKNPVGVKVMNLGEEINTIHPEYCPVVSADGNLLIFTSRRPGGHTSAVDEDGRHYEDIYQCKRLPNGKWSKPKMLGSNINSGGHEAAIGLSPDGQLLFIYKDDNNDGNIYQSRKTADGWSDLEPLGSNVNTEAWETHASVTAMQDMLVFSSNRSDDGFGGRDLWYCKKLPNGEWGLAMNMGSVINTNFEEDSPFITADGKTLIFSSQGHTSMGGFDIFRSDFEDGAWTVPENIGYPINTSEDDVFFVLNPDGRTAYYSSRMDGGYGDTDIYRLKLDRQRAEAFAVVRGSMKVPASNYADIQAKIIVSDEGGAQIGTYRPNSETGYYVLVLEPGETYQVSYEADGYNPIVTEIALGDDQNYETFQTVVGVDEVVFGEDILALQKETERLEEERLAAEAKAAEEALRAEEAKELAKQKAAEEALAAQKEEERRKAEQLAAEEKKQAELALAEEKEKAELAELDRRKAEAKARFEAMQAEAKKKAEAEEAAVKEAALLAKKAEEERLAKEAEAIAKAEAERVAKEAAAQEEALAAKKAEEKRIAQEAEQAAEKAKTELLAQEAAAKAAQQAEEEVEAERLAQEAAAKEAALAAKKAEEERLAQEAEQAAAEKAEQLALAQAQREAEAAKKREELQQRIEELKSKKNEEEKEVLEVREVAVQKTEVVQAESSVDAQAIEAKRQAMLARIAELKKRKAEVAKEQEADKEAIAAAKEKQQVAETRKQELETKAEETKETISELQTELKVIETEVAEVSKVIEGATEERVKAEEELAADLAEEEKIQVEEKAKQQEAKRAAEQLAEIERLEKERIEQERLAAEQFEAEQRKEAEKTKQELIQLEAIAEQQLQVQTALLEEEKKKKAIEAAEATAYSQEEIARNAQTIEQLRELNLQLIKDNLELKKQLAELNAKLDKILKRLEYQPEMASKVEMPASSTMRNLQDGKRLVLRNIFFDYNQATLRSRSKYELKKLYDFMKANPSVKIQVSGHTDARGDDEYNLRLSKNRAQAVVDYLVRNGIPSYRLNAVGYGETRPIARNENPDLTDNPVGRQLNRRIEISIPQGKVEGVEVEEIQVPEGARIK